MQADQNCIFTFIILLLSPAEADTDLPCSSYKNHVVNGRPLKLSNNLSEMEIHDCFDLCHYLHVITFGYGAPNSFCSQIYNKETRVCNLAHFKLQNMVEMIRAPVDRLRENRRASLVVRNTIHCSSLCDLIPTCSFAVTRSRGRHGHLCLLLPSLSPARPAIWETCKNCTCKRKNAPRRPHMSLPWAR